MADAVPPTGAVLMAAHKYLGTRCAQQNAAFIACKSADRNPEACLAKGSAVTSCSLNTCDPGISRPRFSGEN